MEEILEGQEVQENEVTNVVEEEKVENTIQEEVNEVKEEKNETLENAPVAAEKQEGTFKRFFKKLWAILKMEV